MGQHIATINLHRQWVPENYYDDLLTTWYSYWKCGLERKGAQSFGKGNFKALFEAIEREQGNAKKSQNLIVFLKKSFAQIIIFIYLHFL